MCVTAGFIVGFDTEKVSVADAMVDLIEEAAIPAAMVGLLWALPNTQLTRRREKEGRLHADYDRWTDESGDQCALSLNFDSLRPERDILLDYRRILERVYDPAAYARRLTRLASKLDFFSRAAALPEGNRHRNVPMLELVSSIFRRVPEARDEFWNVLRDCRQSNPAAVRFYCRFDGPLRPSWSVFAFCHRGNRSPHWGDRPDRAAGGRRQGGSTATLT